MAKFEKYLTEIKRKGFCPELGYKVTKWAEDNTPLVVDIMDIEDNKVLQKGAQYIVAWKNVKDICKAKNWGLPIDEPDIINPKK